jgi:hypothetical protein
VTDKVLDCLGVAGVRAVRPAWIHRCAARWEHLPEDAFAPLDGAGQPCWEQARPPPPPSRTKWTRLVHPSVLTGHVSSLFGGARPRPAHPAPQGVDACAPAACVCHCICARTADGAACAPQTVALHQDAAQARRADVQAGRKRRRRHGRLPVPARSAAPRPRRGPTSGCHAEAGPSRRRGRGRGRAGRRRAAGEGAPRVRVAAEDACGVRRAHAGFEPHPHRACMTCRRMPTRVHVGARRTRIG